MPPTEAAFTQDKPVPVLVNTCPDVPEVPFEKIVPVKFRLPVMSNFWVGLLLPIPILLLLVSKDMRPFDIFSEADDPVARVQDWA